MRLRHVGIKILSGDDESCLRDLVDTLRQAAEKQNIKLPKRVKFGGNLGTKDAYIVFHTSEMCDLIKRVVQQSSVVQLGGVYASTGC